MDVLNNNLMRKENKEKVSEDKVIGLVCEDEDAWFDGVMFGFVASAATKKGEGNQALFPDSVRETIEVNKGIIFESMKDAAREMGYIFGATSHPGCGGGDAQAIPSGDLPGVTKSQCETFGLTYFGDLPIGSEMQTLKDGKHKGYMGRIHHNHEAEDVLLTTSGGITNVEKKQRLDKTKKKAFQISLDWACYAMQRGMKKEDIIEVIVQQLKVANVIAPNVNSNKNPYKLFNAGRLKSEVENINANVSKEAIRIANVQRSNWKAASHH